MIKIKIEIAIEGEEEPVFHYASAVDTLPFIEAVRRLLWWYTEQAAIEYAKDVAKKGGK